MRPAPRVEVIFDLARLTPDIARQLEGELAQYWIVLDSLEDTHGKYTLYDCRSADEVLRSVWLLRGREIKPKMTLRATLSIVHHAGYTAGDGTVFPGVVQYRLRDAARER